MKKIRMKKIISIVLIVIMIGIMFFCMTGCFGHKGNRMDYWLGDTNNVMNYVLVNEFDGSVTLYRISGWSQDSNGYTFKTVDGYIFCEAPMNCRLMKDILEVYEDMEVHTK